MVGRGVGRGYNIVEHIKRKGMGKSSGNIRVKNASQL
jgi:hypothetical protein